MLVVRVEIWPYGVKADAETLGEVYIINDGSGTEGGEIGNYSVSDAIGDGVPEYVARIEGHERAKGFWPLVERASSAMQDVRAAREGLRSLPVCNPDMAYIEKRIKEIG